jgi:hypothetical protein
MITASITKEDARETDTAEESMGVVEAISSVVPKP